MAEFARYFDLLIHHENEIFRKANIDPDLYSYIVLLNEISELGLNHVSTKQTVDVLIKYKFPGTETLLPLKDDMDVVNMFHMHRNGSEIHVFVELNNVGDDNGNRSIIIVQEDVDCAEREMNDTVNGNGTRNSASVNVIVDVNTVVEMAGHAGSSSTTVNVSSRRKLSLDQEIYASPGNPIEAEWEDMGLDFNEEDDGRTDSDDEDYEAQSSDDDYESFSEEEEEDVNNPPYEGNSVPKQAGNHGIGDELSDVDDDREEGLGLNSDSESDIPGVQTFRGPQYESKEGRRVVLQRGMMFVNINEFRSALREFTIQEGFDIQRLKNERRRITCRCSIPGCTWRIHASPTPDGVTYQVKTYESAHTCVRRTTNQSATSSWIASKLKVELGGNPNMKLSAMRQILEQKYGLNCSDMKLYRARCIAKEEREGGHRESYNLIPDYAEVLLQYNSGSVVKIQFDRQAIGFGPTFKRIFICFEALKTGFLKGCRPFIGLDGCHLKGPYGGILLAAVALDRNNGIYPLAIGVVESECKDSWHFFLYHLSCVIGQRSAELPFTFMSDRQKGIGLALNAEFPGATHRICCRHLLANIKTNFTGISLALKNHYWIAARASNKFVFEKAMAQIKKCSEPVYNWLIEKDVNEWPRHTMNPKVKVDHVTNNITESFNSWVGELREKPIMSLLEGLRSKLMGMLHNRFERALTWDTYRVTPVITKKLDMIQQEARFLRAQPAGQGEYSVTEGVSTLVVNLPLWTCNCGVWDISGIPCKHAAICIMHERRQLADYVHHSYTRGAYVETYKNIIHPVPDQIMWETKDHEKINPPPLKRLPGRPRVNRRREPDEQQAFKRSGQGRCKTCGHYGHNKRTCQRAPVKSSRNTSTSQGTIAPGRHGVQSSTPLTGWDTNGGGITMLQPVLETSVGLRVNQGFSMSQPTGNSTGTSQGAGSRKGKETLIHSHLGPHGRRILAQTTSIRGRGLAARMRTVRPEQVPATQMASNLIHQAPPPPPGNDAPAATASDFSHQVLPANSSHGAATQRALDAPQQGHAPSSDEFAMF